MTRSRSLLSACSSMQACPCFNPFNNKYGRNEVNHLRATASGCFAFRAFVMRHAAVARLRIDKRATITAFAVERSPSVRRLWHTSSMSALPSCRCRPPSLLPTRRSPTELRRCILPPAAAAAAGARQLLLPGHIVLVWQHCLLATCHLTSLCCTIRIHCVLL